MLITIDIKDPTSLKDGDLLIYKNKKMIRISKEDLLQDLENKIEKLNNQVYSLKQNVKTVRDDVKSKQKKFVEAFIKGDK
jgi:chaperonin cofactor prefoldin